MKLTKLYDLVVGMLLGAALTLLVQGHNDLAMVFAMVVVVLRLTAGRTALANKEDR